MSAAHLMQFIGKPARFASEGLTFPVTIKDVRSSYGRTDFLILPVGGKGEKWAGADRVTVGQEGGQ